jgi:ketosteroid isomerase-like protein
VSVEQAMDVAYDAWTSATAAGDPVQFRDLLYPDWFGTTHDGMTVDADGVDAFLTSTRSGARVVDRIVASHGDVHLVNGRLVATDAAAGESRFVALWRGTGTSLTCLTHHETRVVESAFAEKPPTTREVGVPLPSTADATTVARFTAIYDEMALAMPAQDLAHLDEVIDENWFTTDPGGQLRDKAQYMDFARQYYAPSLTFEVSELVVRGHGPFAVTSCRYMLGGSFGDGVAPNQAVRVTGVWRQRGADWVYAAQQGSFIP